MARKFNIIKTVDNGSEFWKIKSSGNYHREDGPSVIYANGLKIWCKIGNVHRIDGPAIEWLEENYYAWFWNGSELDFKSWAKKAKLTENELTELQIKYPHIEREYSFELTDQYTLNKVYYYGDTKKIFLSNGVIAYKKRGNTFDIFYRNDDPGWEYHHEDGPAVIYEDGTTQFWLNGVIYPFKTWYEKLNKNKDEISTICKQYNIQLNQGDNFILSKPTHWASSATSIEWAKSRESEPTIIKTNGDNIWIFNGNLHRVDGPAIENFCLNHFEWYIDGKRLSFNNWCKYAQQTPERIKHLHTLYFNGKPDVSGRKYYGRKTWSNEDGLKHRVDGPAVESFDGSSKEWFVDGKRHRVDGPAIEHKSSKEWFVDGKRHRVDGPAIEHYVIDNDTYDNNDNIHVSFYMMQLFNFQPIHQHLYCWYYNDEEFDFENWCIMASVSDEKKKELFDLYCSNNSDDANCENKYMVTVGGVLMTKEVAREKAEKIFEKFKEKYRGTEISIVEVIKTHFEELDEFEYINTIKKVGSN